MAPPRTAEPPPRPSVLGQVEAGAGIVIQRPTPGWVRLSLWIEVGSRDSDPPQLATAAARWAAGRAHATARTLPDGTEIYLDCDLENERLRRCIRQLASALDAPPPTNADMASLLRGLRHDRLRQRAAPTFAVEQAALRGLLGEAAKGMAPLGDATGDAAVTAAAIGAFIEAHYGPNRALLVAAGDLDDHALQGWHQGLRPAQSTRSPLRDAQRNDAVRVLAAEDGMAAFAMLAPGVDQAAHVGRAFTHQYPSARASAFAIRGGALLLVRLPVGQSPWQRLESAGFDLLRLTRESDGRLQGPLGRDDLQSLTRRTGEVWVTHGEGQAPGEWHMAVAVALHTPEPVSPRREGAEGPALAEWQKQAEAALQAARQRLEPQLRGDADAEHALVRLPNGVHIEVHRRAYDARFAASAQFSGGSALDPSGQHGRAALLATLAASACASTSAPALAEQLRQSQSRMRPLVNAERWGVLAYGDAGQWQGGVDRLLRCALAPSFRARDIEDARLRLVRRLRAGGPARLAWSAAHTLLPRAPGAVAPWGSPQGLAAVSERSLRAMHRRSLEPAGVVLRMMVPADARVAAAYAARRVAQLSSLRRKPSPFEIEIPPARDVRGTQSDEVVSPRVWVGFVDEGAPGFSTAVAEAAAQVAHRLDALPGYEALALAGDSGAVSWIWLELRVDVEQLDGVPAAVEAAARAVRNDVPSAISKALRERRRADASEASDPVFALRAQFYGPAPDDARACAKHVRALLQEPPRYLIVHPLAEP